jgi:hypothetical protein
MTTRIAELLQRGAAVLEAGGDPEFAELAKEMRAAADTPPRMAVSWLDDCILPEGATPEDDTEEVLRELD